MWAALVVLNVDLEERPTRIVAVEVTRAGTATGYVVDCDNPGGDPGLSDSGSFVVHVEAVPPSVPPTTVVLAVGRALKMIAEHGTFRILWSQLKLASSQHERGLRLQMYERDDEDEEHRRQQEEGQQEEEDEFYMQQREDEEEEETRRQDEEDDLYMQQQEEGS
jgi:hypothetical protein